MLTKIVVLIIILAILTFIIIQLKNKKNIWQKISFLYNQLYTILIEWYYKDNSTKKDILKEEILDYYKEVVENNNIDLKYKKWQDIRWFIIQYYSNSKIPAIYDMLDTYYLKYYRSIQKSILLLAYLLLLVVILFALFTFKFIK